ncbi:DNA repair protein RadA [Nonlabens tegetincola]|uniref:DNA repair protein RadA n=1 Tax=Nonlabens tegetincola TaxID=323273 RepID=UPI000CF45EB6|nr:DNA repair protein RadA [Nonlabens tegetincola]PQJ20064.1 DNA repair protein RadA [Nonlabens tegetincola]
MAKVKTTWYCQNCGAQYAKWQGQCTTCKKWDSLVEEVVQKEQTPSWQTGDVPGTLSRKRNSKPQRISEINAQESPRLDTTNLEFNRVLGGGLVPGSVTLLGGEPGIGKSTLLLQVCLNLPFKTLYVSGEESAQQIKMRADRINKNAENCYILTETKTQNIFKQVSDIEPDVLIIDSIQTLQTQHIESTAGSVSQIRECTGELIKFAKQTATPVIVIGHITKDGHIAGPKILEHMVDTVLQFEGDRNHTYRILRALKNRFGSTHEIGIYEMLGHGLREVTNPSEILIANKDLEISGTAIAATMEGMRPLMIEVQALVSTAVYGTPQRSATGYNLKRLNMILAVLEKRAGFKLGQKDVFLNITGGINVDDPAIDLAVVAAILSSNFDIALNPKHCFSAEVGLGGEIRTASRMEQRINEAGKLGFERICIAPAKQNFKNSTAQVVAFSKIEDLVRYLFA